MSSVEEYFQSHFGRWLKRVEYPRTEKSAPSTWVYQWPRPDFGMSTFTTAGYSEVEVPGIDSSHRIEFMFSARHAEFDLAAQVILTACATPLNDGLPLRLGHTIGPLHDPIGAGMTRLLLTEPWEKEPFGSIDLGGRHAQVLMIVPLYESEYELLRSEGEETLWEVVEAHSLDITDLDRSPAARAPK